MLVAVSQEFPPASESLLQPYQAVREVRFLSLRPAPRRRSREDAGRAHSFVSLVSQLHLPYYEACGTVWCFSLREFPVRVRVTPSVFCSLVNGHQTSNVKQKKNLKPYCYHVMAARSIHDFAVCTHCLAMCAYDELNLCFNGGKGSFF